MSDFGIPMMDTQGYLEVDQVHKIIESVKNKRDKVLLILLWRTGARISEILDLKAKNFDFDNNMIHIKTLKRRKPVRRIIPMDEPLSDIINDYIISTALQPEGKLFKFTRFRAYQLVRRAGEDVSIYKVGDTPLHPHHFRHSFIIFCLRKGWPLEKIQKITRHASISMLSWYMQFSSKEVQEDYEKIWESEKQWLIKQC